MSKAEQSRMAPLLLGWLGVIPFAVLAYAFFFPSPIFKGFALQAFMTYSAVILSFLGGVRWGGAIHADGSNPLQMCIAILPAGIGWAALLLDPQVGIWVLTAGHLLFGVMDVIMPVAASDWYRRLRIQLASVVTILHVAFALGLVL